MRKSALLLAALAGAACNLETPSPSRPVLATLGTFEGEMDPVAGTLTIRSTGARGSGAPAGTSLVFDEGASTVTISSASAQRVTDGCAAGVDALQATVTITRGAANTGFAGGLYAQIQDIVGTGGEGCNSSAAPAGLDATKGLWSHGTVRTGATTAPATWRMKIVSGQRTTFTGRIVGVPGTTLAVTASLPQPENPGATRSPTILHARDRMAYVAKGNRIVYVNLDGTAAGSTIALPESGRSLAFQEGADASADVLWFTTSSYVGVVYQGAAHSRTTSDAGSDPWDGLGSVVVDPTTPDRAWFIAQYANSYGAWSGWFRNVQFDRVTKALTVGTRYVLPWDHPPFGIAIAPPRSASGSTDPYWIYVVGNDAIPIQGSYYFDAYDFSGNLEREFLGLPAYPVECHIPFTPVVGPGNVLWFGGYRDVGYPGSLAYSYQYSFCSYDPATDAFTATPIGAAIDFNGASGAVAVGPAVSPGGSGSVVWGIEINPAAGRQSARQLVGAASTQFSVEWATSVGWGWDIASMASSPAMNVGGVDYPSYLWVTTANGVLRMQPQ